MLPVCVASGVLIFLYFFFSGPRLGPHYDYLLRRCPPPPVSREVVIIETDPAAGFVDIPGISSIFMTLAEMGVRGLAVQTPVLAVFQDNSPAETELPGRLEEEFTLLTQNIKNLFQAILMGSISPGEAEQYVDGLIGLTEQGKKRLLSVLAQKDAAGMGPVEQAAAVLGVLWKAGDVHFSAGEIRNGVPSLYSRSTLDPDGVFRRIYPLRPGLKQDTARAEHVVYAMMNRYFGPSDIEYLNGRPVLRFKREGFDRDIALDSRGAVLAERPRGDEHFKRFTPEDFREYERADTELALFLDGLREQGYFAYLAPEAYPSILYAYSNMLREDLLRNAGDRGLEDLKVRWLDARTEYLRSLENFAAGPSEMNLVMSYEERIAEDIEAEELQQLVSRRNGLIRVFAEFRQKYNAFLRLRSSFSAALAGSFCILGPGLSPQADSPGTGPGNFLTRFFPHVDREPVPSDVEASAILANAILSGRAVIFPPGQYILLWSLVTLLLILFLIRRLGSVLTLLVGFSLTLLAGAVFSWGFILTRYWFDPLIPMGSAAAGVLASFLYTCCMKRRDRGLIRRLYSGVVGPAYLKRLVRAGRPLADEILQARAAIVAIRKGDLPAAERDKDPLDSAGEIQAFREKAALHFKNAGGVLVGLEGDLMLFAFGSPLERIAREGIGVPVPDRPSPEAMAVRFIRNLLKEAPETAAWRFGIDAGNCAFGHSELSGYAVFGRPVVYARILSGIASRYQAHILVTARVTSLDGCPVRKLDAIASIAGKGREIFYEVIT